MTSYVLKRWWNQTLVLIWSAVGGLWRWRPKNVVARVLSGRYNYGALVEKVSDELDRVNEVNALADRVSGRLQSTLKLEFACLLLADADDAPQSFPRTGAAGALLERRTAPIERLALRELIGSQPLTGGERWLLDQPRIQLVVPVLGRTKLLGVLGLGPKRSGAAFTPNDLRGLPVIAHQVGIRIQNIRLDAELERYACELTRLHHEITGAREAERKRLAHALHDHVIQSLIALNLKLAGLDNNRLALIQGEIHQIVDDLRWLYRDLRPPALDDLGLVAAIRSRLRDLANQSPGALHISLNVDGDEEQELPEEVSLCLFRVLQEALSNVQKHADAKQVCVAISLDPQTTRLTVRDDGKGFAVPAPLSQLLTQNHFGLVGLREQLKDVGGMLVIDSAPGNGTALHARVPLGQAQPQTNGRGNA